MTTPTEDAIAEGEQSIRDLDALLDANPEGINQYTGGGGSAKTQEMRAKLATLKERTAASLKTLKEAQGRAAAMKAEYEQVSAKTPENMAAHVSALRERIAEVKEQTRKIERANTRGEDRADGKRVQRLDRGEKLAPPVRLGNGWLRCEGRLARVGIQEYDGPTGTVRELRLPEDVFRKETLDSFHLVPVTATHPPVLLDASNASTFSKGTVGEVRQDGDWIVGPLMVTDATTITRVESGEIDELSTGYTCELDETQDPALTAKWGKYDVIQRNILANHEALVQSARAGPDARIRLDHNGNASQEKTHMIRIDGLEIKADDANAQVLIDKALKAREDAKAAAEARADKAEKLAKIVKENALMLDARIKRIRAHADAMKAVAKPCDECDGTGKVPDGADPAKSSKCDLCDGTGSFRMHSPIKAADADPAVDMDTELDPDQDMDADELETEQSTEQEAGKAAKQDARRRDARKAHREAVKKQDEALKASVQRRIDRAVRERAALEGVARRFVTADLSKMDADGIRKAVLEKLSPKTKLDGLDSAALKAKFDTLVEAAGDVTTLDTASAVRAGMSPFVVAPRVDATEVKEDGSHLSGYARQVWLLDHPVKEQAEK